MLLLEDKRSEVDKIREQLIQDGFIRVLPDRIEVNVELRALAYTYGAENVEHFSKLLNKILSRFDHELGYSVEQSHGMTRDGYSVLTILKKREQRDELVRERIDP